MMKGLFIYLSLVFILSSCGNKINLDKDDITPQTTGGESLYDDIIVFNANMNENLKTTLGDCSEVSLIKDSDNSDLIITNNNEIEYQPNLNFSGTDQIVIQCKDLNSEKNLTYKLIYDVDYKNHNPTSEDFVVNVDEDSSVNFSFNITDIDQNETGVTIVTSPSNGLISGGYNNYTYTPNPNFSGSDFLEFRAFDNDGGESVLYRLDFIVGNINDGPSSSDQSYTFLEDSVNNSITLLGSDLDGDSLTYTYTNPSNGTLSCTNDNCLYTPNANYNGLDSFTYTVSDGVDSSTSTVSITVTAQNDPPSSSDLNITTNEDTSVNFSLVGSDLDGDSLTYTYTNPSNGTLTCTNENCTYTPNSNYTGSNSFTYTVSDGTNSSSSTVNITVNPVNDTPVSNNLNLTTNEDTDLNFSLDSNDSDGDSLTYSYTNPSNGTLTCTNENCVYSPNTDFTGTDTFTYKVNDGTVDSNTATVTIDVVAVDDSPVAYDNSYTFVKDSTNNSITLTSSDVDSGSLNYTVVSDVSNGTLTCTNKNCTYNPDTSYVGADSFTYKVNDGNSDSNTATISITVISVNDAPSSNNLSITVAEDSTNNPITLSASDPDSDPLTYTIISNPTNGTLICTNENCTYTPNPNYNGTDSFTYKANDGEEDSNTATVNITVTPENDAPVSDDLSFTTNEDTSLNLSLVSNDTDGDSLTYTVVSTPINGSVSCTTSNCTYTPNPNYNGSDSFTYKTNDGTTDSNIATVNITVTPVNDTPTTNSNTVSIQEDTTLDLSSVFIGNSNDVDGDSLAYEVINEPSNGTISGTHPNLVYTPNSDYVGSDSVEFRVFDGTVYSNNSTITINVTNENDAPVSYDQSLNVDEDDSVNFNLTCTDVENDSLTYSEVSSPSSGNLTCTNENCTYTPNSNYNGSDSFTFKCNDGLDSNISTVSITVNSVNDAPTTSSINVNIQEEETLDISTLFINNSNDVDGDSLTYEIVSGPSNGSVSGSHPNWNYTPNTDYSGTDLITFRVFDGTDYSNTSNLNINILNENDAPVSSDLVATTNEDNPVAISLSCSDADLDSLTYIEVSSVSNGSVSCTNENCTYTPNLNYNGSDSFTYKCNDGAVDSNTSTVSITVNPVNDTPEAQNQSISLTEGESENGTLYGNDIDGDSLTYELVSSPLSGTFTITNSSTGAFTYSTSLGDAGSYTATYRVFDGTEYSTTQTISITVDEFDIAPRDYSIGISINKDYVNTDLTDFPVSINLGMFGDSFWDNTQSNGEDLVVTSTDNHYRYSMEIVNFNQTNRTGIVFVKLDVSSSSDTNFLLKYGSSSSISQPLRNETYGSEDVWSNGYAGVWHMGEDITINDSTSSQNNLTKKGAPIANLFGPTHLNSSNYFNADGGEDDSYLVNDTTSSSLDLQSELTVEAWVLLQGYEVDMRVLHKKYNNDSGAYSLIVDQNKVKLQITDSSGFKKDSESSGRIQYNQWNYIATSFNNSTNTANLFLNGSLDTIKTDADRVPAINNNVLEIGGINGEPDHGFRGLIDEVRLSSVVRSEDWINTNHTMIRNPSKFFKINNYNTLVVNEELNTTNSNNLPTGWTELENASDQLRIYEQTIYIESNNDTERPQASYTFPNISSGKVLFSFDLFFWNINNSETTYTMMIQTLDSSSTGADRYQDGIASNLKVASQNQGMSSTNGIGHLSDGSTYELFSLPTYGWRFIQVEIDLDNREYKYIINGFESLSIPFEDLSINSINEFRFFTNGLNSSNVQVFFDNITVKQQ